jgi:hypothetical protein
MNIAKSFAQSHFNRHPNDRVTTVFVGRWFTFKNVSGVAVFVSMGMQ